MTNNQINDSHSKDRVDETVKATNVHEVWDLTDHDITERAKYYLKEFALDYPPGNATCFAAGAKMVIQLIKQSQSLPPEHK